MSSELASLREAVEYAIDQGELQPHQAAAFSAAWDRMSPADRQAFSDDWRAVGSPAAPPPGPRPGQPIILGVPYFSQLDSATGQGERMCFSSTCAMLAEFLKPGCLAGAGQQDDRYLRIVDRIGDTTDASSQIAALKTLGINAQFRQDGSIEALVRKLAQSVPVPVGWLHRGPVGAPSGGGHWSLAVGWDPNSRQVIMHDPNGEADLVRGGYMRRGSTSGKALRYSQVNWGRRWMVEGPGTGWWLDVSRP